MKNSILEYNIFEGNLNDISLKEKSIINTINPHSYVLAKKDKQFKSALLESNVLLPDGVGIVFAHKLLRGKKVKKIAGFDMFINIMERLNDEGKSCFFLGAAQDTLTRIQNKTSIEYPNVAVSSYSPPYKDVFSEQDNAIMIAKINMVNPDVLFIGMTAPKQEKWSYEFKNQIDASIICSIGAVFDFYADTVKRPNKIWIIMGLEWLFRLIKNPNRLWKRTFISMPIFIRDIILTKFKKS